VLSSSVWYFCDSEEWSVANLLCAQVNSASYPQRDGKWVVAYGLRGEGLVWLIGAVVCRLAANRGSSCSLTRAMDGRIVRCGIISSCKSAATSEIVKRFWSRTHVRSAITSIATFAFTFNTYFLLQFPAYRRVSLRQFADVVTAQCLSQPGADGDRASVQFSSVKCVLCVLFYFILSYRTCADCCDKNKTIILSLQLLVSG